MKKLLSLMLSLGLVISFAGCSKDDEGKKEPKKEEEVLSLSESIELAYEEFNKNVEEEGYSIYANLDTEEYVMEYEVKVYADGTFEFVMETDGTEISMVCGVDGEYSMGGVETDSTTESIIKDACENTEFSDGYEKTFGELLGTSFEDIIEEDEDLWDEEDDYYTIETEDFGQEYTFDIYKDGTMLSFMSEGVEVVIEVL